jgi:hypothetical protein
MSFLSRTNRSACPVAENYNPTMQVHNSSHPWVFSWDAERVDRRLEDAGHGPEGRQVLLHRLQSLLERPEHAPSSLTYVELAKDAITSDYGFLSVGSKCGSLSYRP